MPCCSLCSKVSQNSSRQFRLNFRKFCLQTSLHGWKYLVRDTSMNTCKQLFWAIIVMLSMVTASTFLFNNTWDFVHTNVITTVDTMTAPLTEVFFPSVVVCNINQVRESFFQDLTKNSEKEELKNLSENNAFIFDKFGNTHQSCKDLFVYSKWNGSTSYGFTFARDFGTDYGICCWFTPQFNFSLITEVTRRQWLKEPDWGYWFNIIGQGSKTGKDNGYTMLLDIETFDYKYFREGSEGLKVTLVHHMDMPIMRQSGFHISPGTDNQIAITPTLLATSKVAMNRFPPEQRNCYSEEEIALKYLPKEQGYRYEMNNCLFEAAFEEILEVCQCFPGIQTKGMNNRNLDKKISLCQGSDQRCVNSLINKLGQFEQVSFKGKKVKCRPNCVNQLNSVFVTSSAYPNKRVFVKRPEFCLILIRLWSKCQTSKAVPLSKAFPDLCDMLSSIQGQIQSCHHPSQEGFGYWNVIRKSVQNCTEEKCPLEEMVWKYARRNLAMLNIFIKDPYAKRFLKDVKTTKTSYFAKLGGILSLCMGFSLISAAEIIFHCLKSIFPDLKEKKSSTSFQSQRKDQRAKRRRKKHDHCCRHPATGVAMTTNQNGLRYPLRQDFPPSRQIRYCQKHQNTNLGLALDYGPERFI